MFAFLNRWPFSRVLWLFPLAITAHMMEESLWLPHWSLQAEAWHVPVSTGEFLIASLILVAFVCVVTYVAARGRSESPALYVLLSLALLMLLNIFHPHLGAFVFTGTYAPGLATGLLVILPVMSYLLVRAFREGQISWKRFTGAAVLIVPAAAFTWPGLFWVGRSIMAVLI